MSKKPVSRLRTLWLGETARAEFAAAADVIRRETDCTLCAVDEAERVPAVGTPAAGAPIDGLPNDGIGAESVFDVIVSAESFPDEVSPAVFATLRRRHPVARWVRIVGPWCDGELRSTVPPPATLRIPWHRAAAWFSRQFERRQADERPEFDDPVTFDEADRVLATRPRPNRSGRQATFGVWAVEPAAREWLMDTCRRLPQLRPSDEQDGDTGVEIVFCDLPTADRAMEQLAEIRKGHPRAALVVLVGFARPQDVRTFYQAGAAMVLAKPVAVVDLEAAVEAVASRLP